jgi:hypothetical protein
VPEEKRKTAIKILDVGLGSASTTTPHQSPPQLLPSFTSTHPGPPSSGPSAYADEMVGKSLSCGHE